ncbi:hypothetical protein EMIHUDRAFT_434224, partial [Emiliania huxleyi CCMP1516]|uniref:VASt domain-containing protein n=2 Tax=Emiliania huxleyi TaxID=2903 RepID=A0A0D3K8P9_EMIH1
MHTAADPMQTGPTQNDLESTYNADISSSDLLLRQKPYGPVSVRVDQRFLAPRAVSLSVSIHSLCYGDRKVPLCEVESCNHVEGARLRVNLANRERPKWFTFSSAAEAAAFCAVTRRCLDHAAPPHASPRSDKKRAGRGVLGGLRALLREKTTPQDDMLLARTFAFSDESTGGGGSAAARSAASARSRSAAEAAQGPGGFEGCAERHPLELALFGVLLPLLFAGYWLSDAGRDYFDRRGTWLRAACRVWEVETFVSRRYHHGKWAEARNAEYRNGASPSEIFILERAWNVSVVAPTVAHGRANSHWHKIQHTLTGAALDPSARYTRASGRPFRSGAHPHEEWTLGASSSFDTPAATSANATEPYTPIWDAIARESLGGGTVHDCRGEVGEELEEATRRSTSPSRSRGTFTSTCSSPWAACSSSRARCTPCSTVGRARRLRPRTGSPACAACPRSSGRRCSTLSISYLLEMRRRSPGRVPSPLAPRSRSKSSIAAATSSRRVALASASCAARSERPPWPSSLPRRRASKRSACADASELPKRTPVRASAVRRAEASVASHRSCSTRDCSPAARSPGLEGTKPPPRANAVGTITPVLAAGLLPSASLLPAAVPPPPAPAAPAMRARTRRFSSLRSSRWLTACSSRAALASS